MKSHAILAIIMVANISDLSKADRTPEGDVSVESLVEMLQSADPHSLEQLADLRQASEQVFRAKRVDLVKILLETNAQGFSNGLELLQMEQDSQFRARLVEMILIDPAIWRDAKGGRMQYDPFRMARMELAYACRETLMEYLPDAGIEFEDPAYPKLMYDPERRAEIGQLLTKALEERARELKQEPVQSDVQPLECAHAAKESMPAEQRSSAETVLQNPKIHASRTEN